MKVGDIVTQSDEFYKHWECETFHLKIIKITNNGLTNSSTFGDKNIICLEKSVTISKINNFRMPVECSDFHKKFLKIDIPEMRKEKLKKLNNEII